VLTPRSALASARIRELEEETRVCALMPSPRPKSLSRENDRLRQMVGYPARTSMETEAGPGHWTGPGELVAGVHFDIGALDGVITNLAVLAPGGLSRSGGRSGDPDLPRGAGRGPELSCISRTWPTPGTPGGAGPRPVTSGARWWTFPISPGMRSFGRVSGYHQRAGRHLSGRYCRG
jgi:hypothetical protein